MSQHSLIRSYFIPPSLLNFFHFPTIFFLFLSDPIKVMFLNHACGFGYVSNDKVKEQYKKCMMNGELERICNVLCAKNKDHDSSTKDSALLEEECDKCRGKQRSAYRNEPTGSRTHRWVVSLLLQFSCRLCNLYSAGFMKLENYCLQKLFDSGFFWE